MSKMRVNAFLVVLENDISEESAKEVMSALSLMRGVAGVTPNEVDVADSVARMRLHTEIKAKLYDLADKF